MSVKFNKADINAVANSRYFRKSGVKLIMLMIILLLAMSVLKIYMTNIPTLVAYFVFGFIGLGVAIVYERGERKVRRALWDKIRAAGLVADGDEDEPQS